MRIDETKEAFAQALRSLMAQRSFVKISVSDIATEAGLSRKTFYNHFKDKYELINWVCYTQFVAIRSDALGSGGWGAFRAFLEFFASDRRFFADALQDMGQNSFGQYFSDLLFEVIYGTAAEGFRSKIANERWMRLAIAALAENARLAIIIWLEEDESPDVDTLLGFLTGASDAFASMICFDRVLRTDGKLCDHAIDLLTDQWDPKPKEDSLDLPKPNETSSRRRECELTLTKYRPH